MKLTIVVILSVLAFATAAPWKKTPSPSPEAPHKPWKKPAPSVSSSPHPSPTPSKKSLPPGLISPQKREFLRKRLRAVGGCNANICMAIDGSSSMPAKEFDNQKKFALDVASVIGVDMPVEMAAVQYATGNTAISPLTVDIEKLILKIDATKQRGGASFLAAGINYCFSQLWRRIGEANKILLFGDGNSNLGANAEKRADLFRRIGGEVSVVAAGFPNKTVLEGIALHPENIYNVTDFLDVLQLQEYVEDYVYDVCG